LRLADLERALDLPRRERAALKDALGELHGQGRAFRGQGGRWFAAEKTPTKPSVTGPGGTLRVFPSGRSEVLPDDGSRPLRVHNLDRGPGLDGDRVRYEAWDDWDGRHGRVLSVNARGRARLTGLLVARGSEILLEPDDPRLPAPVLVEDQGSAAAGESVVARILRYPSEPGDPLCVAVSHRLGNPEDPRTEVQKLLIMEDIEEEPPPEVTEAVTKLSPEITELDLEGRSDLRHLDFVTIDPGDARDFDDAVCVEEHPSGWRLHVAVADVSHYVTGGSLLDASAENRAQSVYLPDRALHMLPTALATDLCSLAPGLDRLAMVVTMLVDEQGGVIDEAVCAAVIRSRERLTYEGVARVLAGRSDSEGASDAWRPELARLTAVAGALRKARDARGGLDFDLPEAHVVLDEDDPLAVRDVRPAKPDPWVARAYRLIEECMVAANESVGRFAASRSLPIPWRVHDTPSAKRFGDFVALARELGVKVQAERGPSPLLFQSVLGRIEGHPARAPLQIAMLRCLAQAVYDAENRGHFALAAPAYLHFTSPIRRYPDLLAHRVVKRALAREGRFRGDDDSPLPGRVEVAAVAAHCSESERRAVTVERAVTDMYRAHVMRAHIGEVFDGAVSGVAEFGLFVRLEAPFVEGLVKREALGRDRWNLSPGGARLVGERSGRSVGLGDRLSIRVLDASIVRRQITFELKDPPSEPPRGSARTQAGTPRGPKDVTPDQGSRGRDEKGQGGRQCKGPGPGRRGGSSRRRR
ncbi:MAG: VacB/RNase II family 3'-5' exoribonuclease, partial [Polyangia bacterium]|nr:VacB/RNase II family 3'-5' exoribonuclease [Polyangia bacterium]